jgi:hypothetical protein
MVTTLKYDVYHLLPTFHIHIQARINLSIVVLVALHFHNYAVERNTLKKNTI